MSYRMCFKLFLFSTFYLGVAFPETVVDKILPALIGMCEQSALYEKLDQKNRGFDHDFSITATAIVEDSDEAMDKERIYRILSDLANADCQNVAIKTVLGLPPRHGLETVIQKSCEVYGTYTEKTQDTPLPQEITQDIVPVFTLAEVRCYESAIKHVQYASLNEVMKNCRESYSPDNKNLKRCYRENIVPHS